MVKGNLRMKPPFRKKHMSLPGMCFLFTLLMFQEVNNGGMFQNFTGRDRNSAGPF